MKTLTTTLSDKKSLDQKSSLEPLAQVELQCKRDVIYQKKYSFVSHPNPQYMSFKQNRQTFGIPFI